jgi:hypothetical protein
MGEGGGDAAESSSVKSVLSVVLLFRVSLSYFWVCYEIKGTCCMAT